MLAVERKRRILEILREHGQVEAKMLAQHLHVSLATIRRDLMELEQNGSLVRTHGGALAINYPETESVSRTEASDDAQERQRVARRAVALLQDGDTVVLDSDPILRQMARMISGLQDVTVVTHDLKIALMLADKPGLHVYHTGGIVQPKLQSTYGIPTIETYKKVKVNKAFLGADALHSTEGLMTRSMDRAATTSAIVQSSGHVIVVADRSKIERMAVFRAVEIKDIDTIITSVGADPAALERIQMKGVGVEIV